MKFQVGVEVTSEAEPGGVGVATEVLRRRLDELTGSRGSWSRVRTESRVDSPPSMGAFRDLVLEFDSGRFPDAVTLMASFLVRALIGHLRGQPDLTQGLVIREGGGAFLLSPGMSTEELAQLEAELVERFARHQAYAGGDSGADEAGGAHGAGGAGGAGRADGEAPPAAEDC